MESFLRDEVDLTYVVRIAVAPFENNSKEQFAPERVRGMAITEILAQGLFDVVDKGLVDSAFREEAVDLSKGPMDAAVMKRLGQRLNVQAFLMGSIDQAGDVQRGPNTFPALAMTLRLVDAHTGMIFWQASGSRSGDSLGKRLFGLGSDDEFKVSLRLLRQLLASISSEKKIKLPTAVASSPVMIEPAKPSEAASEEAKPQTEEPAEPAAEGKDATQATPPEIIDQQAPPAETAEPPAASSQEAGAGQEESLDQAAPEVKPEPEKAVPQAESEGTAQDDLMAPSMEPAAEPAPEPQGAKSAPEPSGSGSDEKMLPAETSPPKAEDEGMKPAEQSAPPAPSKDATPSLQLDQAWPE